MPVTVTQATNNNSFAGFALQRPNIVGNPSLPPGQRTPAHYFNTAAFATAPQFVLGLRRGIQCAGRLIGTWIWRW